MTLNLRFRSIPVDKAAIPVENRVPLWRSPGSLGPNRVRPPRRRSGRSNGPQAHAGPVHDSTAVVHRGRPFVHAGIVPGWAWPSTPSTGWWWWWRT